MEEEKLKKKKKKLFDAVLTFLNMAKTKWKTVKCITDAHTPAP